MNPTLREPAFAGTFYPASAHELQRDLAALLGPPRSDAAFARLLLAPHAGLAFSGAIAAEGWSRVTPPGLVVFLAPNHHGLGAPLAMPRRGSWRSPLGVLDIDEEAAEAIAARMPALRDDWRAFSRDHAIEVQLLFLQARAADSGSSPRLVTISCGALDLATLTKCGEAIAGALAALGRSETSDCLLVVSADMSHFLPALEARERDLPALRLACALDAEGLHAEVAGKGISTCGLAPMIAGLACARALGALEGELVRYGHSGETSGDDANVVAYATVLVRR